MDLYHPTFKADGSFAEAASTTSPYQEPETKSLDDSLDQNSFANPDLGSVSSFSYQQESQAAEHCSIASLEFDSLHPPNPSNARGKAHGSPFQTYLSVEYSSTQSPSMASDSLADTAHDTMASSSWQSTSPPTDFAQPLLQEAMIGGSYPPDGSAILFNSQPTYMTHFPGVQPSGWQATSSDAPAGGSQTFVNYCDLTRESSVLYIHPHHTHNTYRANIMPDPSEVNGTEAGPSNADARRLATGHGSPGANGGRELLAIQQAQNPRKLEMKRLPSNPANITSICKRCKTDIADEGSSKSHKCKNEWKRHIMTQHIVHVTYACPHCDKSFKRKDLFASHYKRLHLPKEANTSGKSKDLPQDVKKGMERMKAEADVRADAESPEALSCFVYGCQETFSRSDRWQRCLDHVAVHLDRSLGNNGIPYNISIPFIEMKYLVKLKTIKISDKGNWVLGELSDGEQAKLNKKKLGRKLSSGEASNTVKKQKTSQTP